MLLYRHLTFPTSPENPKTLQWLHVAVRSSIRVRTVRRGCPFTYIVAPALDP